MTMIMAFLNFSKKKIGFYKLSFRFFYFSSISRISTPISRIPTQIPCISTLISRIPTLIPRILTLIPRIPTPISWISTPIPRILLIPFPGSPSRFLQIANLLLWVPTKIKSLMIKLITDVL